MQLTLRSAEQIDFEDILSWRNNPSVRRQSFNSEIITRAQHQEWWESREERGEEVKIFCANEIKLGVVRILLKSNKTACEWSFFLKPLCPSGSGAVMEQLALAWLFDEKKLDHCFCKVLEDNVPVIKLHKKFGFTVDDRLQTESTKRFVVMSLSKANWQFFRDANHLAILKAQNLMASSL